MSEKESGWGNTHHIRHLARAIADFHGFSHVNREASEAYLHCQSGRYSVALEKIRDSLPTLKSRIDNLLDDMQRLDSGE